MLRGALFPVSAMPAPPHIIFRLAATGLTLLLLTASTATATRWLLPAPGVCAHGIRIQGETIPENTRLDQALQALADRLETREVQLAISQSAPPQRVTLRDLGVRADASALKRRALAVGHDGSLETRVVDVILARRGRVDLPLTWTIDANALTEMLARPKDEIDRAGSPARFDFQTRLALPHTNGWYLDVFATVDALDRLARDGGDTLRAVWTEVPPIASADMLRSLDISQVVGHYDTKFGYLAGQADRAQNILTAASRLDGVVLLPSEVLSFNTVVGPRTLRAGFRKGWEIFKGEMVQGVGGGTCQVAGTLHAAAYLAGFDVVERSPHSRPSSYIPLGLDATVVDGLVDLKLRNPFPFPVVLHSVVRDGTLTFELLGREPPASIAFHGDVVAVQRYKRKVTEAAHLAPGRVLRKQRGIRGYTVRKTRTIVLRDGSTREEVTTDVYPPTLEVLLVPPGTDPDTLPPLPEADRPTVPTNPPRASAACSADCPAEPKIVDTPEARHSTPPIVPREVSIKR